MAEDSAFWDDGTGDATTATVWDSPYDSEEFSDFYSKLIASDMAKAYVIPNYLNNLEVTESTTPAMSIKVATGALSMRGRIYGNPASTTVALSAADPVNPRIDRIVAEITFASQTVRMDVVEGVAGAVPALPALTQNATTYQVDLAHVWIAATETAIENEEISDRREFAPNFAAIKGLMSETNLVVNSEFICTWHWEPTGAQAPAMWLITGTPSYTVTTKPAEMCRGQALEITAGADDSGWYQVFRVTPSTTYAIRYLYYVTAGDVGLVNIYDNGAGAITDTRYLRRTGSWYDEYVYYTTSSNATTITIELLAQNNGDIIKYGQVLAIKGYIPGNFRPFHETIGHDGTGSEETNWFSVNKPVNTYTIDLTADFGATVLKETRGATLFLRGVSNPAGASVAISSGDTTPTYLSAVANMYVSVALQTPTLFPMIGLTGQAFYIDVANQQLGNAYCKIVGVVT